MPGLRQILNLLGERALDLVFPIFCLQCGKEGVFVCTSCLNKLRRLESQTCISCEKPSPVGQTHPGCSSKNKTDALLSVSPYSDPLCNKAIKTFKYNYVTSLAPVLGRLMAEEIANNGIEQAVKEFVAIPVPLHHRKFRERGFNQSELLAKVVSSLLEIPLETSAVERSRYTKPQSELMPDAKKDNIRSAFSAIKKGPKKVLLIDDVVTSGSTLNEVARQLKKAGTKTVWALTFARG